MIYFYIAPKWKFTLHEVAKNAIGDGKPDMGKIMSAAKEVEELQPHLKFVAKEAQSYIKKPGVLAITPLNSEAQKEVIEKLSWIFKGKWPGIKIQIFDIETDKMIHDPKKRAQSSLPHRVAFYIE